MNILGLIPARGGSKGIPEKAIAPCAGHPLLYYTAREAKKSQRLTRCILSTDSEKIASVGKEMGMEVPFLRPGSLATDESPMIGVLRHALEWAEGDLGPVDAIVLLQPTSPLRQALHIDQAIDLFFERNAESVVSVSEVPHQFTPTSLMEMQEGRVSMYLKEQGMPLRRQDKPRLFARNGPAILVLRPSLIREGRLYGPSTYGYVMPADVSYDIDTISDMNVVELLLKSRP